MMSGVTKILDLFNHLARDILQYLIPGLFLIGNIFVVDSYIYNSITWEFFADIEMFPIIIVLVSYGLGQFTIGVMYLLVEKTHLERVICKKFGYGETEDIDTEIKVYLKNRNAYEFYIERYNQLYYLRWNLSGVGLIGIFINGIFYFFDKDPIFILLFVMSALIFILMLFLHYETGNHMVRRIKIIYREIKNIED